MSLQYHKEKLEENIEGIKGQAAEFKKTYFDEDTEWNEGLGKKAWYPLKKIGELSDHVNDQVSLRNALQIEKGRDLLPGQTWDDAALVYSFKSGNFFSTQWSELSIPAAFTYLIICSSI